MGHLCCVGFHEGGVGGQPLGGELEVGSRDVCLKAC